MKKLLVVFFLVGILLLLPKREKTNPVFNESTTGFSHYFLDLKNCNINTKNYLEIIKNDTKIIVLYPYVNDIYKKKFVLNYKFDFHTNEQNISKFTDLYLKKLNEMGFNKDSLLSEMEGIRIKALEVYMDAVYINDLLNVCSTMSIKLLNNETT